MNDFAGTHDIDRLNFDAKDGLAYAAEPVVERAKFCYD
jgi:hypothetical protein